MRNSILYILIFNMSDSQHGAAFSALHTGMQHDDSAKVVLLHILASTLTPKWQKASRQLLT